MQAARDVTILALLILLALTVRIAPVDASRGEHGSIREATLRPAPSSPPAGPAPSELAPAPSELAPAPSVPPTPSAHGPTAAACPITVERERSVRSVDRRLVIVLDADGPGAPASDRARASDAAGPCPSLSRRSC